MQLLLQSRNTVVTLKVGRYVEDASGRLQAMSLMKSKQQRKCERQKQPISLTKFRRKSCFWKRRESISRKPKRRVRIGYWYGLTDACNLFTSGDTSMLAGINADDYDSGVISLSLIWEAMLELLQQGFSYRNRFYLYPANAILMQIFFIDNSTGKVTWTKQQRSQPNMH